MIIGSHVKVASPNYLLDAVKDTLNYGANACMLYTGAPSNAKRMPLDIFKIEEAHQLLREHQIPLERVVIHAPYLINLANCTKPETFELGVSMLKSEIERTKTIGAKIIVLHPGSHVLASREEGLAKICEGLDQAMGDIGDVLIALETMAGKGSECGVNFQELKQIIDGCQYGASLRVCLDTCHIHDAGYDLNDFDAILDEFDQIIGLERLVCIHLNDSKNTIGAHKDRHANLGYGEIGFEKLMKVAHHPRLENIIKILETPYVDEQPPYQKEISMIKANQFEDWIKTK